jgi:hypothetical protein
MLRHNSQLEWIRGRRPCLVVQPQTEHEGSSLSPRIPEKALTK